MDFKETVKGKEMTETQIVTNGKCPICQDYPVTICRYQSNEFLDQQPPMMNVTGMCKKCNLQIGIDIIKWELNELVKNKAPQEQLIAKGKELTSRINDSQR